MTIAHRIRSIGAFSAMTAAVMFPMTSYAAGAVFNGQPNDYPTLQVGKDGGSWQSSISATAGDTLSLLVWDHNSVPDTTAHNVHIKVTVPTNEATTHVPTATISADDAASVTGSVTIDTAPGATTMSYIPGSAKLYKNSGGSTPTLVETSWPTGVNPDTIITTGVNLGDQNGCWQYAKAIILQVKLNGVTPPPAVLKITKTDRRTVNDPFSKSATLNPGDRVEYQIVVENIDEQGIARNLKLQDFLPTDVTYVAGSGKLTKPDGTTVSISDGVTGGMVILDQLKPHEKVTFDFLADTSKAFSDGTCVTNRAKTSADNATNSPEDTAKICFVVKPTPTPTPSSTPTPTAPTPTPQPTLPHTGPEGSVVASLLVSGFGLSTGRYAFMKRKVKRQSRSIDII